jgi:hypothetical protein
MRKAPFFLDRPVRHLNSAPLHLPYYWIPLPTKSNFKPREECRLQYKGFQILLKNHVLDAGHRLLEKICVRRIREVNVDILWHHVRIPPASLDIY